MAKKTTKKVPTKKRPVKVETVSPLKALKIIAYVLLWLVIWSSVAFVMAGFLLVFVIAAFYGQEITPTEANSSILVTTFLVAGIFFGVFWLLRKRQSLFMKVSRLTLITCTAIGLVGMIVTTVSGYWVSYIEPENTPVQQKEVTEVKEKKEVRRWQYMLCSDGAYRYFTDEQFKDPDVGFTEESEDFCASSGNGKKTKLADSPPNNSGQYSPYTLTAPANPTSDQSGCETYNDIEPTKVVERPDSNMKEGYTREVAGYNGWRIECKDASGKVISNKTTSQPGETIRYYGTYTASQAYNEAQRICNIKIPAGSRHSTFYSDCISRELSRLW